LAAGWSSKNTIRLHSCRVSPLLSQGEKMKTIVTLLILSIVVFLGLPACGLVQTIEPTPVPTPVPTSGKIEGVFTQQASDVEMSGTVVLMPEKYFKATPNSSTTLEPGESTKVEIGQDHKFTINDIKPGRYYLDVSVGLNPCFLGAPGQVFNGMIISFKENWNPMGLSFKNGSSMVTGKTEVYEISAGQSLNLTLELPTCY
jgi:hypothetical protein